MEEGLFDEIKTLLETQLLFSLFLEVALGFLVGEINIKGFPLFILDLREPFLTGKIRL